MPVGSLAIGSTLQALCELFGPSILLLLTMLMPVSRVHTPPPSQPTGRIGRRCRPSLQSCTAPSPVLASPTSSRPAPLFQR